MNKKQIRINEQTYKLLMVECVKELIIYNPDMKDEQFSPEFMVRRLCLYYLDRVNRELTKENCVITI
jgi:hypothetical protein